MEESRENTGNVGYGKPPKETQFKPGQTGNPNGRPRKLPDLEDLLAEVLGEDEEGKVQAKAILTALYKKAVRGDVRAAKELLDRGYGQPKQTIQNSHTGSFNLIIMPQDGNDPIPE